MKTRREKTLRQPVRYEGGIPQYSLGGIAASTLSGAGMGAIGGGGALSIPGAIIGGGIGLVTGLFSHFKEKKQEKAEEAARSQAAKQSAAAAISAMGGADNNYTDMWQAGQGGIVSGGKPVKIRSKEMMIGPDGTTVTSEQVGVTTPQHTNKGIIPLADGTVIVSPENSRQAKLIAARQKPEITKWNKILDNPQSTPLARKTAERRLAILKQEYMPLIQADAEQRVANGGTPMGGDNIPQAALGQVLGNFFKNNGKDLIQGGLELAPVLFNAGKSMQKADYMDPAAYQNPLAYNALATMRDRQPNMTPALQASDAAVAGADANLRSTATGRGQYMSGRIGLANAAMTNKANIYAQGQQQRNQYLGEYGQMQGNIGQGMAQTKLMVDDLNARNEAAQRNYGAAATGQLSQWAQVRQQMNNQKARDAQMMETYQGFMDLFKNGSKKTTSTTAFNIEPNPWANWADPNFKIPAYRPQ